MNVMVNDTIVHKTERWLGIVEHRIGGEYSVSRPDAGNQRERIRRDQFELFAERLRNACEKGRRSLRGLALRGNRQFQNWWNASVIRRNASARIRSKRSLTKFDGPG